MDDAPADAASINWQPEPLWNVAGLVDHGTTDPFSMSSSPLVVSTPAHNGYLNFDRTINTSVDHTIYPQFSQQHFDLVASQKFETSYAEQSPWGTDAGELEYLRADNAELTEKLRLKKEELDTVNRAIRDLAAWTLNERTKLMTEALQQRFLREECEIMLRQRDEQVTHLLALSQESKLEHVRTLVREGAMMNRPVSLEYLQGMNKIGSRVGWPPIDQQGTVLSPAQGTKDKSERAAMMTTQSVFGANDQEEGEVDEGEDTAYSPPNAEVPTSIIDQVDALIAEEKSRLAV